MNAIKNVKRIKQVKQMFRITKISVLTILFCVFANKASGQKTWDCGEQGNNVTATLKDSTMTIAGSGAMKNYGFGDNGSPWHMSVDLGVIKNIVIENGVTSIGKYTFNDCENATSITIGNSVASIGERAFSNCRKVRSVTIPKNVTSIEKFAFSITWLNLVTVQWTEPLSITSDVFYNLFLVITDKVKLCVPKGTADKYRSADVWKTFTNIQEECGVGIVVNTVQDAGFRVYPNPTNSQLRIENYELRMGDIEVYDVVGRKIVNCQLSIDNSIDISHLEKGLYFLKVNGKMVKFVKE